MKKLSIKNIVDFRGRSSRSKQNFAINLKNDKEKASTKSGGDYWVSCISAISRSYRLNDLQLIVDKRYELEEKYKETEYRQTKTMYKRNINILCRFENFNLDKWRPSEELIFLKKHKENSILNIKGLQIQVSPNYVFTFQKGSTKEIGAIWFIAKLDGFRVDELGMFTDVLYRYLKTHFSKDYNLNPKYCIAVDVFKGSDISYLQLEENEVPRILNSTLDEISKLI